MGDWDENVIVFFLLMDDLFCYMQLCFIINKVFISCYLNVLVEEIDDLVEGMLDDFDG